MIHISITVEIEKRFKDFSLDIKLNTKGKTTGLLGASGCGKSLTLKCIAGIATPDQGRIALNNKVLYDYNKKINLPPKKRGVGLLFQNYALFPNMNVKENIEIAIRNKKNRKEITDRLLTLFHIGNLCTRYPHQLSGGEQQRVALARMMAYEPEVLMFDEPFSALDSYLKDQLQQEFYEVLKAYTGDVIMVSHSRDELYRFCEQIVIIHKGHVIEAGDKEEVFGSPTDIATAKLTGCKNISRARKLSDYEVEAIDWKLRLETCRYVEEDICYVGIRAHNLRPSADNDTVNTIPTMLRGFFEGPFENTLILNSNNEKEEGKLWWIVSKRDWKEIYQQSCPERISIPKEHLLLLKDNSRYEWKE